MRPKMCYSQPQRHTTTYCTRLPDISSKDDFRDCRPNVNVLFDKTDTNRLRNLDLNHIRQFVRQVVDVPADQAAEVVPNDEPPTTTRTVETQAKHWSQASTQTDPVVLIKNCDITKPMKPPENQKSSQPPDTEKPPKQVITMKDMKPLHSLFKSTENLRAPDNQRTSRTPDNRRASTPPDNQRASRPPEKDNRRGYRPPENRRLSRPRGNRDASRSPDNWKSARPSNNNSSKPAEKKPKIKLTKEEALVMREFVKNATDTEDEFIQEVKKSMAYSKRIARKKMIDKNLDKISEFISIYYLFISMAFITVVVVGLWYAYDLRMFQTMTRFFRKEQAVPRSVEFKQMLKQWGSNVMRLIRNVAWNLCFKWVTVAFTDFDAWSTPAK